MQSRSLLEYLNVVRFLTLYDLTWGCEGRVLAQERGVPTTQDGLRKQVYWSNH